MNYKKYLHSKHWLNFKYGYFLEHKRECRFCKSDKKVELHHLKYDRLGKELFADCIPLCNICHSQLHKGIYFKLPKQSKPKRKRKHKRKIVEVIIPIFNKDTPYIRREGERKS